MQLVMNDWETLISNVISWDEQTNVSFQHHKTAPHPETSTAKSTENTEKVEPEQRWESS